MAKGCCGGGSGCGCQIIGQGALNIDGSGTAADPFIISVDVEFTSSVNKTFTVLIDGDGSSADPYSPVVSFSSTAQLDDLPDVAAPAPTNGQVLAWNAGTSRWVAQAPAVVPAGAILHDTSLAGDGSAGTPLAVAAAPTRMIGTFADGIGLTDQGMASSVLHFVDAASRAAAVTAPWVNQITTLDTDPGILWYWTGSVWALQPNQTNWEAPDGAMLELSGPWSDGLQPTLLLLQIVATTDAVGGFDVLSTTDLTGRSGVLSVTFTEQGPFPWKAMLNVVSNKIVGTAYRVDDGSVMVGTPVAGTAQAILY